MNTHVKDHLISTYGTGKTIDILFEVLNAIPVSVFIKNEKLEKIFANKANLELDEREVNSTIGYTDFDIHTPENAETFAREDKAVLASGTVRRNEESKVKKDGKSVNFLTHKNRIVLEDNTRLLVGTNTIIDEIKEREAQLSRAMKEIYKNRANLMEITNAIPLGITLLSPELDVIAVNTANRKFWNIDPDKDFTGKNYTDLLEDTRKNFPEMSEAEWAHYVERCLEKAHIGDLAPSEITGINGAVYSYSSVRLSNGNRLGSYFDVSTQKQAQSELAQAIANADTDFADLKATMDCMRMGVVLLDKDMNIIFINKANYRIWNARPEEIKQGDSFRKFMELNRHQNVYDVLDENWHDYVEMRLDEIAKGDIAPREFHRTDGVTLIYSCTALSDGKRLACYYDITEQKNAEKVYQEAEQKAVLADRAKSEFLANMSHEIRTPMNGVLGMAELLARTELDAKQKTFTDIIVKSGNALLTIINDILDFSKIDAGQLALDPAPFRLAEAIEDVATLVSARAQEKDLELIVRVDPGLPEHFVGDVGRIRQIVTNLMGNAVKFTEAGHVVVDVSGQLDSETGMTCLKFKITDTGVGIHAEKVKLVFEKFSQVDTSSTRRHEGTGLGLAISTKLVALMGGEIGAESEVGKGSTFWFTIKLPAQGVAAKKKVLPFDVEGSRVLIVDDNHINRSILLEQMRSWSFDACAATGGREGLEVLKQVHSIGLAVDVIILDYHMPEQNGADVARAVRENPNLAAIPIILLTSVDTAMQGSEFHGIRIDGHLMKPARSSLLFDTIVGVIREAQTIALEQSAAENAKTLAQVSQRLVKGAPIVSDQSTLPVKPVQIPPLTIEAPAVMKTTSSLDILIAEDNAVNQIVFTQILEGLPYTFEIVDNGRKAFEAMKSKSPTIILMDVSMPEMNGLEATGAIREYESSTGQHRTPIIGVTAHALKGDRDRCIEAGMDDYLSKPISPDMLAAKIETHMAQIKQLKSA